MEKKRTPEEMFVSNEVARECFNCGNRVISWSRNGQGQLVCNVCGSHVNNHNVHETYFPATLQKSSSGKKEPVHLNGAYPRGNVSPLSSLENFVDTHGALRSSHPYKNVWSEFSRECFKCGTQFTSGRRNGTAERVCNSCRFHDRNLNIPRPPARTAVKRKRSKKPN
ncbi:hypothetical protein TNIN_75241 [Trichonephila inaurata madagascariensis]|uniref:GATA-type domain-containing protein n=1 Tax=Trichonephila inaurata madagascariensis TaxID=2747483 RepID=A0A8X7C7E1_9ARAC|nr:hypothetical protein TNIN_75241 [Trichonephila inaurata madagascariensis]